LCNDQGAVDGHDVRQGRRATAGGTGQLAGVTPEPAPITMLSRGILGGDGDRPELAAAARRTTVAALVSIYVVATTKCCLL